MSEIEGLILGVNKNHSNDNSDEKPLEGKDALDALRQRGLL